jgi:AcrR family transcriptional regulator
MIVTVKPEGPPSAFRARKKLETMRYVQLTALGLFEVRGFDAVTIEDVARASMVSAPTIYRHFGTKESLVLWDEYDPMLFHALAGRLRSESLVDAIREAILRPLDRVYVSDASRILRRVRLANDHAGLRAAVAANLRAMRRELARIFVAENACRDALEADVVAGATTTALEIAIEHWAQADGKRPLRRFIEQALRRLRRFAARTGTPARGAPTGGQR